MNPSILLAMSMRVTALIAAASLAGCLLACDSATENKPSAGGSAPGRPGIYLKSDGDQDADERGELPKDDYTPDTVAGGRLASKADEQAIATVIREYFTAAAAADGAKACPLLDPALAASLVTETSSTPPRLPQSCATALSSLFAQQHQHFAAEEPKTMTVIVAHVKGSGAVATLGFTRVPEAQILLQRTANGWKVNSLFDGPVF